MLLVVEDGDEHVEVVQQVLQADLALEGHALVWRIAPGREAPIQLLAVRVHGVAKRLEEAPLEAVAPCRKDGQGGLERKGLVGQLLALPAATGHRGAEDTGDGDGEEGASDVGAVVDVRLEAGARSAAADEA